MFVSELRNCWGIRMTIFSRRWKQWYKVLISHLWIKVEDSVSAHNSSKRASWDFYAMIKCGTGILTLDSIIIFIIFHKDVILWSTKAMVVTVAFLDLETLWMVLTGNILQYCCFMCVWNIWYKIMSWIFFMAIKLIVISQHHPFQLIPWLMILISYEASSVEHNNSTRDNCHEKYGPYQF